MANRKDPTLHEELRGLIIGGILTLILALTNPTADDFNRNISQKIKESGRVEQAGLFGALMARAASFTIESATVRRNYYLFSIFKIDNSLLRTLDLNMPELEFLGVAGLIIPLWEVSNAIESLFPKGNNSGDLSHHSPEEESVGVADLGRGATRDGRVAPYDVSASQTSAPAHPKEPWDCGKIVSAWNAAHITKDVAALDVLYDDEVLFYGSAYKKTDCLAEKRKFIRNNPSFAQSVSGIEPEQRAFPGEVRCRFVKSVSLNGKSRSYPSYLVVRGDKIVTESDEITDAKLEKRKQKSGGPSNDTVSGDFNGDGALEYAWVDVPPISGDELDCIGECVCAIRFSDSLIPSIFLPQCIGGKPEVLGDLNGRAGYEIGLAPEWFTSCWSAYHVWTLLDGKWVEAVEPISIHCEQLEEGIRPIEADAQAGRVIVRSSKLTDHDIEVVTRSVPIRR